jgi:hypothetical protein
MIKYWYGTALPPLGLRQARGQSRISQSREGQSTPAGEGNLEGQGSAGKSGTDDYRDKSERFKGARV